MKSLSQKYVDRFWGKVNKEISNTFYNGVRCWEWTAGKEGDGYGAFCVDGKQYKSHRISWYLHFGEIPQKASILHHCDNPSCVNPKHLFSGTQRDNMRDKILKGRQGDTRPISPSRIHNHQYRKLTDGEKFEVRIRYDEGESSYKIASDLGVSQATVHKIATREN